MGRSTCRAPASRSQPAIAQTDAVNTMAPTALLTAAGMLFRMRLPSTVHRRVRVHRLSFGLQIARTIASVGQWDPDLKSDVVAQYSKNPSKVVEIVDRSDGSTETAPPVPAMRKYARSGVWWGK